MDNTYATYVQLYQEQEAFTPTLMKCHHYASEAAVAVIFLEKKIFPSDYQC